MNYGNSPEEFFLACDVAGIKYFITEMTGYNIQSVLDWIDTFERIKVSGQSFTNRHNMRIVPVDALKEMYEKKTIPNLQFIVTQYGLNVVWHHPDGENHFQIIRQVGQHSLPKDVLEEISFEIDRTAKQLEKLRVASRKIKEVCK